MPLKALLDGQPILAPLLGDREWAELYFQRSRLVLPCCPGVAVQMRGGAGTARIQHFSHTPTPTCQFRGETTVHLLAKVEIARACAAAGWAVDIEHAEDDWRADVLAEEGGRRVAFEVQWSRQTMAETEARQARYRAAGVRGCWFVRYPPRPPHRPGLGSDTEPEARQDLPLFVLTVSPGRASYEASVGDHAYPLGQVVAALLGGRIAFRSHRTFRGEHAMDLTFYDKACPSCAALSRLYRIASRAGAVPRASCGRRVLLWSGTLYHPDVVRTARLAYQVGPGRDAVPLALITPSVGFRCPACGTRLAPSPPTTPSGSAMSVATSVAFSRPLCDPYAHWCFPHDDTFCTRIVAHDSY